MYDTNLCLTKYGYDKFKVNVNILHKILFNNYILTNLEVNILM